MSNPTAKRSSLTRDNALLYLEVLLLRERLDLEFWDTRQMRKNMMLMDRVVERVAWSSKEEKKASNELKKEIQKLIIIIQNKDATLVNAGHTHLEEVVSDLRKKIFDF